MTKLTDLPTEILLEIIDHVEQNAAFSFWLGSANLGYTCTRMKELTDWYQQKHLAKYYANNKFWDMHQDYTWEK